MYMLGLGPREDCRAAAVQAALDMAALRCAAVMLRGSRLLREECERPLSTAWELGCQQVSMEMADFQPAYGVLRGQEALGAAHLIRAKWVTKEEATRHGWPATIARTLTRHASSS